MFSSVWGKVSLILMGVLFLLMVMFLFKSALKDLGDKKPPETRKKQYVIELYSGGTLIKTYENIQIKEYSHWRSVNNISIHLTNGTIETWNGDFLIKTSE